MEGDNTVMTLLEGLERSTHELSQNMANQNHEFCLLMMMEQLQQQHHNREFKIEGESMSTYHGCPDESVDEYIFETKLFMSGKNIDYNRHENQTRVVEMLARNLRSGDASWYHSRVMVGQRPIMDIDEFERVLTAEFIPPYQQHCLRAALRACRQTGHVDDYVARFFKIIAQIREISQLDKVDRFVEGLKPETNKETIYAAQAYGRAHMGGERPTHRPRNAGDSGPEPMDLSYEGVVKPTKDVLHQQNLCFYCREVDHSIADCPKRRQGNADAQRM
ncbi:hypothetical protein PsorP6_005811 [Peronosclerospora sorghi]|uniref:Uncharacterized protein n=1 Tax=Peronosclerospora sorghi TaxID=230839 RepID=A0ACC0W1E5_9STRA|nr:hypothetical protein PsorP6_005811 [Peronosclerospora sorghi]